LKLAPARFTAENTAPAHHNPLKEKQAIFEQNVEFHVAVHVTFFARESIFFSILSERFLLKENLSFNEI